MKIQSITLLNMINFTVGINNIKEIFMMNNESSMTLVYNNDDELIAKIPYHAVSYYK